MKLFISWSGELSKEIAEIFRQWIPGVIQAAKPYYSPDDITKGTRWSSEIAKELDSSKIGIICLTKENLESPWIMFEAGALSKNLEKSKVCPLLFGIDPSDIKGPLVQFQASKFSKNEMKKVIKMMNEELDSSSLSNDVLDSVFDMWWPKLEDQINRALEKARNEDSSDLRTERDLLEEVLSLTRGLSIGRKRRRHGNGSIDPRAIEDLIESAQSLLEQRIFEDNNLVMIFMDRFYKAIEHIIEECSDSMSLTQTDELNNRLRRLMFKAEGYSERIIKPRGLGTSKKKGE